MQAKSMNGAESLVKTLVAGGVDTCFANPGTSEMHFVSALDRVPGIKCVLGLFEGVVTGAADGYFRMAQKPAATLLHMGPGLGNGLANLHNARRAHSSIVNIVGDHATYHLQYDAPLTSDIESLARPMSNWVKTCRSARMVGADAAEAIEVARAQNGQIATLILPADTAWDAGGVVGAVTTQAARPRPVPSEVIAHALDLLRGGDALLLIGGRAIRADAMPLAAAVARKLGCQVSMISRTPRLERGAGYATVDRIPNPLENSAAFFNSQRAIVLVDEVEPMGFFARPGKEGRLITSDGEIFTLAGASDDVVGALAALADLAGARTSDVETVALSRPDLPSGAVTVDKVAQALGALMPEQAIVSDESITSGRTLFKFTAAAAPHDWLALTGGSIGLGIPMAVGAATACPDRRVINLQADGSGMYTLQGLWTQARERQNVTTVIWSNRSYKILHNELANVGAGVAGQTARTMLDLDDPALDWVSLARGMGVDGARATTMEQFVDLFRASISTPGPFLIEAVL